jgi:uroporphyrin-III C-methyltransferase/precorrin-2 dehydrogenase/sirohydrochlorin ferrochelatase
MIIAEIPQPLQARHSMDFLPVFLDIRGQPCLVVGGGEEAARKTALLLRAGGRVTVQAPVLSAAFDGDRDAARVVHRAANFRDEDMAGFALAIAATGDDALNRAVAAAARARRIPVNVVDQPALCSFIVPSIVDRAPVIAAGSSGRDAEAHQALQEALDDTRLAFGVGEVALVGAGPGDPDLLTFRALRLMQQADVVVYDRLVSHPILELVRVDAERIYAGKERAQHALPQDDINHLLVRLAREGKRVVRLKGGDPFIFGRGGEEIETLAAEGIPFQVVPGITAAAGCAAYAGIPLTHREFSQSVVFVTGHLQDGSMNLNWPALAQPRQTIVFYMGLVGIDVLCRELAAHGLPRATPAALIQQGTTPQQRVLTGTLDTLPDIVRRSDVRAPTLIIVGEVVRLRERLNWFN